LILTRLTRSGTSNSSMGSGASIQNAFVQLQRRIARHVPPPPHVKVVPTSVHGPHPQVASRTCIVHGRDPNHGNPRMSAFCQANGATGSLISHHVVRRRLSARPCRVLDAPPWCISSIIIPTMASDRINLSHNNALCNVLCMSRGRPPQFVLFSVIRSPAKNIG
jgi:hypothetical protein